MTSPRPPLDPSAITTRNAASICVPFSDLDRRPGGPRDRQLIYGDPVLILDRSEGWCHVQSEKDGYCGYVAQDSLSPPSAPSHWVHAAATHAYETANFKSANRVSLTFGSQIAALKQEGLFVETVLGFVPSVHLTPIGTKATDPAKIATLFLETPYLWGGNSRWGIDCSGLVQAALLACAIACPGDSHEQQHIGCAATGSFKRNDLLFWKGHVALVTDPDTLIHANAGSMTTRFEGIQEAVDRISSAGDGPITAHRRL